MFVVPALIFSFSLAVLGNYYVFKLIYTPEMGLDVNPIPDWFSAVQALSVGLIVPLISSIVPIQKVLDKTIVDSMIKGKALSGTKVEQKDGARPEVGPQIAFGALSVVYGIAIFVFLPMALYDGNLGLMLTIFFMILVGMIFGLTLLASNLQPLFERICLTVLLFWEKSSMK